MGSNSTQDPERCTSVDQGLLPRGFESRSALAGELRALNPRARKTLLLDSWMVDLFDLLVTTAAVSCDPHDGRPLPTRLQVVLSSAGAWGREQVTSELTQRISALSDVLENLPEGELARWVSRLTTPSWRSFALRLLGASTYERLSKALRIDVGSLAGGLRVLSQTVQPFALAVDDLLAIVTPQQAGSLSELPNLESQPLLSLALRLDRTLESLMETDNSWTTALGILELAETSFSDGLITLIERIRPEVSRTVLENLAELNSQLVRKLHGARTALELSEDGVSQAANSIVELIDRAFREAHSDRTVLEWLHATNRTGEEFTYTTVKEGPALPTKRARALCFVYAARTNTADTSVIHEVAAIALVTARTALQKLKHADSAESEKAEVTKYLTAVEGYFKIATHLIQYQASPSQNGDQERSQAS